MKDELAKKKKMEKAIQKWESGKFALECITVEIDNSVIQRGSIGGLFDYGELSCIKTIYRHSLFPYFITNTSASF